MSAADRTVPVLKVDSLDRLGLLAEERDGEELVVEEEVGLGFKHGVLVFKAEEKR